MAKKEERILRSKDVAYILDCSPDDVIELAKSGDIKAVKEGRFWKFRQSDVMEYKKRMEQKKKS